jgi:hypothetical protein
MTDAASHFDTSNKTCCKAATWSGASNVAVEAIDGGFGRIRARRHSALRSGTRLPTGQLCIQGGSPGMEVSKGKILKRHQGDG